MGAPYSQDLRDKVLSASDRGMQTQEVARAFGVCKAWVRRVKQRRRELGQTSAQPMGGATVVKIDMNRLEQLLTQHPDATLKELQTLLGTECCLSAVDAAVRRLGFTFKKSRWPRPSRTGPMSRPSARSGKSSRTNSTPHA